MKENWTLQSITNALTQPFIDTMIMVFVATLGSILIGIIPAILLVVTKENGLRENKILYGILDVLINVMRSLPFLILLIVIIPFTRIIVGVSYGLAGAIVPLTIAASPFIARIIENALNEVDYGVVEAARSYGASDITIIFKVLLKEAVPSLIQGITLTIISIIGYSAMAGVVGGGGLGDIAIRYGYQRHDNVILTCTVILLIILVQIIQSIGNLIYSMSSR